MKNLIKQIVYSQNNVKVIIYRCKPSTIAGISICKVITKIRKRILGINLWITIKRNNIDVYKEHTNERLVKNTITAHKNVAYTFNKTFNITDDLIFDVTDNMYYGKF